MHVDLTFTPAELTHCALAGKVAVVIDVFRFTTAAQAALEAGAAGVFVVREIEEALSMRSNDPSLQLAGERHALKVPGFDFGNSPLEFPPEDVRGRKIVWCTTNGTNAVTMAQQADQVILASLRSAKAAAQYVRDRGLDCVLVPAGLRGRYSLEDTWCAGYIAREIGASHVSDSVQTALMVSECFAVNDLRHSEHGRVLSGLGLDADLDYCLELDRSSAVILQDKESGWCSLSHVG